MLGYHSILRTVVHLKLCSNLSLIYCNILHIPYIFHISLVFVMYLQKNSNSYSRHYKNNHFRHGQNVSYPSTQFLRIWILLIIASFRKWMDTVLWKGHIRHIFGMETHQESAQWHHGNHQLKWQIPRHWKCLGLCFMVPCVSLEQSSAHSHNDIESDCQGFKEAVWCSYESQRVTLLGA